jgi:hypothetical protein
MGKSRKPAKDECAYVFVTEMQALIDGIKAGAEGVVRFSVDATFGFMDIPAPGSMHETIKIHDGTRSVTIRVDLVKSIPARKERIVAKRRKVKR